MPAWLVAWNPLLNPWNDFGQVLVELAEHGHVDFEWNCGQNRNIAPGDRIWLIRLGAPPKGLFGKGHVLEAPHPAPSWRNPERTQMFIPVRWTELLDAHDRLIMLPQPYLKSHPILRRMHWSPRGSGVTVPVEVDAALEREWQNFVGDAEV